jgi:Zn-dependent peptidase ImmA (M78 family)/DNA-binding XRE family transcriptional regulator
MARKSLLVEVDLEVFKWLRESSGWTIEDVAKRLKTSQETILKFEKGEKKPSMRQLKELANAFKRPVAAFLLSKPKAERLLPKDYRMLPDKKDVFDKKTVLTIRKARNLQEVSRELLTNVENQISPKIKRRTIKDDPVALASELRAKFEISDKLQRKFKSPYEFFNHIRDHLEDLNILVFQYSMLVEDARGFALVDKKPNIIVINTKDSIEARLFSLMHEFGHILLGESAIDLADVTTMSQNEIEKWCDLFAANFLLPKQLARNIFKEKESNLTETTTLNYLSRKYKVSKAMLLVSMSNTGFITKHKAARSLREV